MPGADSTKKTASLASFAVPSLTVTEAGFCCGPFPMEILLPESHLEPVPLSDNSPASRIALCLQLIKPPLLIRMVETPTLSKKQLWPLKVE